MKIVLALECVPNRGNGTTIETEYHYAFWFSGKDNFGKHQFFGYGLYVSYQMTAKAAKADIRKRLIDQGAMDIALDGIDPFKSDRI